MLLLCPSQSRVIWYVLHIYLGVHQRQSGCFGKEKYLMPLLEIELEFLGCWVQNMVQTAVHSFSDAVWKYSDFQINLLYWTSVMCHFFYWPTLYFFKALWSCIKSEISGSVVSDLLAWSSSTLRNHESVTGTFFKLEFDIFYFTAGL